MSEKAERIIHFRRNPKRPPRLTAAQEKRLEALPIDYSDIPELPDDFFQQHPPRLRRPKQQITIRIDADVLEFFRAQGPGYQGRINAILRAYKEGVTR